MEEAELKLPFMLGRPSPDTPIAKQKDIDETRDSSSGMGYCVLEPDKELAMQIISEHTIYDIRYNFELDNNEVLTIPFNCILIFSGGSISNGTLSGEFDIIASNYKIFDGVHFTNHTGVIMVDWFITKHPTSLNDTSVDNTSEINEACACGAIYVKFSADCYYRVTTPITITGDIDILCDGTNVFSQQGDSPCIFSDTSEKLLQYNFISTKNKTNLTIGAIKLYCKKAYDENFITGQSIVEIKNADSSHTLWGVDLNCCVIATKTNNLEKELYGIFFNANVGNMSYIRSNGYVVGVYAAYKTERTQPKWITNLVINGDIWAIFGGFFTACNPVIVYGTSQPVGKFTKEESNQLAFFNIEYGNIYIYGHVWDLGRKSGSYYTTKNIIKTANMSYDNSLFHVVPWDRECDMILPKIYWDRSGKYNYDGRANMMDLLISTLSNNNGFLENLSYTVIDSQYIDDGIYEGETEEDIAASMASKQAIEQQNTYSVFDNPIGHVVNSQNLFNTGVRVGTSRGNTTATNIPDCRFVFDQSITSARFCLKFDIIRSAFVNVSSLNLYISIYRVDINVKIETEDGVWADETVVRNKTYYTDGAICVTLPSKDCTVTITWLQEDDTVMNRAMHMPNVFLPSPYAITMVPGGEIRPQLTRNKPIIGLRWYDILRDNLDIYTLNGWKSIALKDNLPLVTNISADSYIKARTTTYTTIKGLSCCMNRDLVFSKANMQYYGAITIENDGSFSIATGAAMLMVYQKNGNRFDIEINTSNDSTGYTLNIIALDANLNYIQYGAMKNEVKPLDENGVVIPNSSIEQPTVIKRNYVQTYGMTQMETHVITANPENGDITKLKYECDFDEDIKYIAIAIVLNSSKIKSFAVRSNSLKPILDGTIALPEIPTACGVCIEDGTIVKDSTGATDGWIKTSSGWVAITQQQSGTTSNRPSSPVVGQTYFDTSLSPNKMIVYNGTDWVNLDGTALT